MYSGQVLILTLRELNPLFKFCCVDSVKCVLTGELGYQKNKLYDCLTVAFVV